MIGGNGIAVVFGVPKEIKPITFANGIEGKLRLRFRNNRPGKAFVKTANGIRCFVIEKLNRGMPTEEWLIGERLEQGRNLRVVKQETPL